MSAANEIDPASSLYDWLAYDLRFYRQKRGLTGTQVGEIINCVRSHVANLEAGRACIDMKQAKALDEAWDTGGHFERLLFFARSLHNPDWFRQSVEYEVRARILRIYQGQTIPVPLQSEDYARAVLSMARVADLDKALMDRMVRQELIIGREDHPLIMVLLDQDALDRPTGGAHVMKAQLRRLLELGERPSVSIRVIARSAGWHFGLNGPFQIMSLERKDVAYIGAFRGGRLAQDASEVREMAVDFELIGAKASSEGESRALIKQLMEGF
ncbi:helix-turn-helix transcriptional regulator [Actinomadura sp. NAK00032]|uniref:helix-turn-helix domain-containing protein n=1 Tax=Actinomadura sp. NAK00032 TaxID=2742128 RepID=UPI0015927EC3|nr:helix-turn-helix transcriptional regulator [Actinomadura sp. NAK00032]QKW39108.1 helix-turn-helix transcriptional regulator [Actinomadura sp. NAK00032]